MDTLNDPPLPSYDVSAWLLDTSVRQNLPVLSRASTRGNKAEGFTPAQIKENLPVQLTSEYSLEVDFHKQVFPCTNFNVVKTNTNIRLSMYKFEYCEKKYWQIFMHLHTLLYCMHYNFTFLNHSKTKQKLQNIRSWHLKKKNFHTKSTFSGTLEQNVNYAQQMHKRAKENFYTKQNNSHCFLFRTKTKFLVRLNIRCLVELIV